MRFLSQLHIISFQLTTSRRGRLRYFVRTKRLINISTHDLTKRSTFIAHAPTMLCELFQLTTSRRGRQKEWKQYMDTVNFNSRPHEEVDKLSSSSFLLKIYFNSRPHEEVDWNYCCRVVIFYISTHDLTKRSTSFRLTNVCTYPISPHDLTKRSTKSCPSAIASVNISTHDLTKRSTFFTRDQLAAVLFQLTTSRRGRRVRIFCILNRTYFNSRPHEEVDTVTVQNAAIIVISTHDLTKRSTRNHPCPCLGRLLFQLTTSRRGRLCKLT